MSSSPRPDPDGLRQRVHLVEGFMRQLLRYSFAEQPAEVAEALRRSDYIFVDAAEMKRLLHKLQEDGLAEEEGCHTAFQLLDSGIYQLSPQLHAVELHQISADMLQIRAHQVKIRTGRRRMASTAGTRDLASEAERTVWVGAVPDAYMGADGTTMLEELFTQFGLVEALTLREKAHKPGEAFKGGASWAFVRFEDAGAAARCIVAGSGRGEGLMTSCGQALKLRPVDVSVLKQLPE